MIFNFAEALAALGNNAAVRIANSARPAANYLFNTFLPERTQPDYTVEAANMVVRSTMAGLVAMDSPYPPGGTVEISTFLANSAKLGISNTLTEGAIRQLQSLMRQFQVEGTLTNTFLQTEALNFLQKVIVQAQLDRSEWLRAQALVYGAINWTFNQKNLLVSYGIPAANFLPSRTDANDDAYAESTSGFWADVAEARRLLRYQLRAIVMNSVTLDEILSNNANPVEILSQDNNLVRVRRYRTVSGNQVPETDARYTAEIAIYDEESEVLDTTPGATTFGRTQRVKFMPDGKILFVGANSNPGYRVGQGSTDNPRNDLEIGWHAICPTVEGGGNPGRWARLYTPESRPMHLTGEGASNELPVILNPEKIVVATTEIL